MIKNKEDYLKYINNYTLNGEIWKDIKEWKGYYQVSSYGRVRSLDTVSNINNKNGVSYKRFNKGKILKLKYIRGYCNVTFRNKILGKKTLQLHRLILKTFKPIDNMNNLTVDHIYGNKHDNNVKNLEWVTNKENIQRGYKLGLIPYKEQDGELNSQSKLIKEQVIDICENKENLLAIKLCKKYNVDRGTVESIWNRKTWINITQDIHINKIYEKLEDDIVEYIYTNPLNLTKWELSRQLNIKTHTITNIYRKLCYVNLTNKLKLNYIKGCVRYFYKITNTNSNKVYFTITPRRFIKEYKICGTSKFDYCLKNKLEYKRWKFEYCTEEDYIVYLKDFYD